MKSSKKLRNFCFTINNYTEESHVKLQSLPYTYLIYGEEIGKESGIPHLQGYCELKKQLRFPRLKKLMPTAHIEPRKGTPNQAATYCKKDGKIYEFGIISQQGKRTDLVEVYNMTKENKTDIEIGEAHPGTYMKYYKAVDRVRLNYARANKRWEPVEVIVLIGEAGTGKTRTALEIDPDLYIVDIGKPLWWDGYVSQQTILLDDYYGEIPYGILLKLLDGLKFQIPIKGGYTWKQWKRVIITSNVHPRNWYEKGLTPALERRIKEIKKI